METENFDHVQSPQKKKKRSYLRYKLTTNELHSDGAFTNTTRTQNDELVLAAPDLKALATFIAEFGSWNFAQAFWTRSLLRHCRHGKMRVLAPSRCKVRRLPPPRHFVRVCAPIAQNTKKKKKKIQTG
jgi:hypothetical protein